MKRRSFLKNTALGFASLALPEASWALKALNTSDPHYFLTLTYLGGWDHSYLFDARPLSMTNANLIQNYTGSEPIAWGEGDVQTWLANPLALPLREFQQDFCILKGLMMATTFDGHGQNENYIFTGNPFGGDSFVPLLNSQGKGKIKDIPLDAVSDGLSLVSPTNGDRIASFAPSSLKTIVDSLRSNPISEDTPEFQFLLNRYSDLSSGSSHFSIGSKKMLAGLNDSIELSSRLTNLNIEINPDDSEAISYMKMLGQLFQNQVSFSGQKSTRPSLDTHDSGSAKNQPETFATIVNEIREIMQFLKTTAFDEQHSLLDVTTVMITSEFSRTMRIQGQSIDNTGTNHNAFNNTVLLAGKGIRGGQLIGDTDFQNKDEELSAAHLQIDPIKEKTFGLPFDFQSGKAIAEKPEEFRESNYLNHRNLVNTLYSLFEVPREHWWTSERNGAPAPTLPRILN